MITCQTATERLVAHWNAPTPQVTEETQAAIEHVHHCPRCAGRLCALIGILTAKVEAGLNCSKCTARLPSKVQAGQTQVEEEAHRQPDAAQSTGCPYCKVARAELEALLDMPSGEPEQIPVPDMAFLRSARVTPISPNESALEVHDEESVLRACDQPPGRTDSSPACTGAKWRPTGGTGSGL